MANPLVTAHTFNPNQDQLDGTWSPKEPPVQGPGWSIIDNFENGTLGNVVDNGGDVYFSDTYAQAGTQSAKMDISVGSTGSGWGIYMPFGTLGVPSVKHGEECWYAIDWFVPTGYSFGSQDIGNTGYKIIRLGLSNVGHISLIGSPDGGVKMSNEGLAGSDWYDAITTSTVGTLQVNSWNRLELYVKMHATNGQGALRAWINGELKWENTTVRTTENTGVTLYRALVGTYWNGGATQTQSNYVDNLHITTIRPANQDAAGNYMIRPPA